MFANILIVASISAFFAIVVLGHALLFTAIWPDIFKVRRGPRLDTATRESRQLHLSS
jgi:hypothetical protein